MHILTVNVGRIIPALAADDDLPGEMLEGPRRFTHAFIKVGSKSKTQFRRNGKAKS